MSAKSKKKKSPKPFICFHKQVSMIYKAELNECITTLLAGIPPEGGSAIRDMYAELLFLAFCGGVAAGITHKN